VRDRWQRSIRRVDLHEQLKDVWVPVLVCVGRHDPQTPASAGAFLARRLPSARLVIFERSGHYPFVEERQAFINVVHPFLSINGADTEV
jgi:pimeloyl-ACP methyl ester carboxylesterase